MRPTPTFSLSTAAERWEQVAAGLRQLEAEPSRAGRSPGRPGRGEPRRGGAPGTGLRGSGGLQYPGLREAGALQPGKGAAGRRGRPRACATRGGEGWVGMFAARAGFQQPRG